MPNNPESSNRDSSNKNLPDIVSQWYYKHGLFLSSYPTCASGIALIIFFISCYPLVNIPLPGTIPTKVVLPFEGKYLFNEETKNHSLVKNIFSVNSTFDPPFPWAYNKPLLFVQQIILRSAVHPWSSDLQLVDAFRAPLYEVFKLLEIIRNHESSKNFDNLCLHVENVKRKQKDTIFPEYNCLILSPANFWSQDIHNFSKDGTILNTVFQHHNFQKGKVSTAEMLLGVPIQDSGFKRYPLRSRSRVIQYAVTLILQTYEEKFFETLKSKLTLQYPLYQNEDSSNNDNGMPNRNRNHGPSIMYIYYPGEFRIAEFMPIFTAFILLFIYVYFSVRKIDVIKSRFFLASFAVFTVFGSLMMSLGLCFFFGLTISLQSKGIYPYLVILVGLENCLVLTKSVVSTDETFDIKIRVAQALSKEGWHISKTLLTEITILTVGLATFVPVIQEFCVFAIVGLISDFILQMFLFSTGLAMNIKRMEYTVEAKNIPKIMSYDHKQREFKNFSGYSVYNNTNSGTSMFHRSHSFPKLTFHEINKASHTELSKRLNCNIAQDQKIPKRLKIVNLWARTRFFQRAFMIWMSIWIFSIIYDSEFLENFFVIDANNTKSAGFDSAVKEKPIINYNNKNLINMKIQQAAETLEKVKNLSKTEDYTEQIQRLKYPDIELNYYLSNFHWSTILKQYNVSLAGKYITILPAIKLSKVIQPEIAVVLRNPKDQLLQNFQWKSLAAALDPLDFNDDGKNRESPINTNDGSTPLYPKSPMEIFIVAMLCAISVFVLTYTLIVFYRCICTRNYAEWRSSWNEKEAITNVEEILEGIPINLPGHTHKIECLVSDGISVVSCCLKGQIKVWDAENGELVTEIDRTTGDFRVSGKNYSPVWCIDYLDNLVAVGCANGRIEFWEIPTGRLKCIYQDDKQGVTHIILTGNRVIAGKLCGRLNYLRLETYYKGKQIDWGFTSAYRRTHVRTGSTGSIGLAKKTYNTNHDKEKKEEITCTLEEIKVAHQQPLTCIEIANGIVFTGSQDHTLRVYNLDDPEIEFTLHGHCGPITCLFVDKWQPGTGGSASQNGDLCVWDLFTGACMYNIQAHDGSISSLVCAPSYVISLGTDLRVCVWERFQGNLLSTINVSNAYSKLCMLTPSLLATSKSGSLIVWDVRNGEPAREVKLGGSFSQVSPKIMVFAGSSVFCDYGNQIKIVKFPIVANKCN